MRTTSTCQAGLTLMSCRDHGSQADSRVFVDIGKLVGFPQKYSSLQVFVTWPALAGRDPLFNSHRKVLGCRFWSSAASLGRFLIVLFLFYSCVTSRDCLMALFADMLLGNSSFWRFCTLNCGLAGRKKCKKHRKSCVCVCVLQSLMLSFVF